MKRTKKHDMVKLIIIPLLLALLVTNIAMMVWAVRRDERVAREQQERIEQCQQGCYTYSQID